MLYSRELNRELVLKTSFADRLLLEAKLPHDFSIRDADIALRGYAIANEERFLFATVPRVRIEIEKSFAKVDSILRMQGFNNKYGLAKIEKYKSEIRQFNDHQYELVNLIRDGQKDLFFNKFKSDAGSNLYPSFVDAIEEVNAFELGIIQRQKSLTNSIAMVAFWLQVITLILVAPLLIYVSVRISKQREQDKMAEDVRIKAQINSTKEEMLSILSHEIRTPLNSMIGLTHVLARRNPRSDQEEVITTLKASGDHLMHMVNDILDYAKIQANRLALEQSPFTISSVLRQVHAMFFRQADENGVDFIVKAENTLPQNFIGDSNRLIQILNNLIGNALKFTSKGSVIVNVHLTSRTGKLAWLKFIVKDTGVGIQEQEIDNIFLPFTQEKHIQRHYGGTGLGLTIVKNLVELMEGNVAVSSANGKGSTFIVNIPFLINENQVIHTPAVEGHDKSNMILNGKNILYVEDVASNRFLVNSILEDNSLACLNAENGTQALESVAKIKFDLILLDVQLPDMSGCEVSKFIRKNALSINQTTPIILFSAFSNISEEEVKNCGANDFLSKPFKVEDLIHKMEVQIAASE